MEAKIFKSIRGAAKLAYGGFSYRKSNTNITSQNWRCDQAKCKGSAATPLAFRDGVAVTTLQQHNHGPEPERVAADVAKDRMLDVAATSQLPPRRIVSETTVGLSDGAIVRLGKRAAMRQKIHRKRRRLHGGEGHPVALPRDTDFDIPEIYQTVEEGDTRVPFVLYDSRNDDDAEEDEDDELFGRYIILGTETFMENLRQSTVWMMDATFKIVPQLFCQLLVVHAVVNDQVFPCLYILMPDKTEESYSRVLWIVKTKLGDHAPRTCIADFELGLHNAVRNTWQGIAMQGCFFHLGQSLWRKAQDVGLARSYIQNEGIRVQVKSLAALAFVNPQDVAATFDSMHDALDDEDHRMHDLYEYFETYYIGRKPNRGPRRRPRFSIETWSVRQRTLEGLPRTNNKVEGFHRGIQSMFDGPNPNIWKFFRGIQRENALQYSNYINMVAGEAGPRTELKYRQLNQRLTTLISRNVDGGSVQDLVRGVVHNVDLH